jgi:uncharacterized protein YndB with AHSA1/START domain
MNEFTLDRTVIIRARRRTVFRYFTDTERFAAWWGAGSSIEPRPGGRVHIRYPGGTTAGGEVVSMEPDRQIVFTYGYDDPAKPIARGGSRVTITLTDHAEGTLLRLEHLVSEAATKDAHVPGWWFQLALFANVVASEEHAGLAARVDRFFAAWSEPDPEARRRALEEAVTDDVSFRDPYATLEGRAELVHHIDGIRIHMPGMTLARDGAPQQCQGVAIVRWTARGPDGASRGGGTNVLELAPDGRLAKVVGLWNAPAPT